MGRNRFHRSEVKGSYVVGHLKSSLHLIEDGAGELVSRGIATHVTGASFAAVSS